MNVDSDNHLINFVIDKCFGLIDVFERDLEVNTTISREWEAVHIDCGIYNYGVNIGVCRDRMTVFFCYVVSWRCSCTAVLKAGSLESSLNSIFWITGKIRHNVNAIA